MFRSPGSILVACTLLSGLAGAVRAQSPQEVAAPPRYHESISGTLVTFEMVGVPRGQVTMGSAEGLRTVDLAVNAAQRLASFGVNFGPLYTGG